MWTTGWPSRPFRSLPGPSGCLQHAPATRGHHTLGGVLNGSTSTVDLWNTKENGLSAPGAWYSPAHGSPARTGCPGATASARAYSGWKPYVSGLRSGNAFGSGIFSTTVTYPAAWTNS